MHGEFGHNMVNLITEKIITTPTISPVQTTVKPVAPIQPEPVVTPEVESKNKKKLVLPLSLIAGGGILLYFGLRRPSPQKLYNEFVKGKVSEMQRRVQKYSAFVRTTLDSEFSGAAKYMEDFKSTRLVDPAADLGPLRVLKDPRKLLSAQDIAFEAIMDVDKAQHRLGAPEFYEFVSKMGQWGRSANSSIEREQRIVKLELSDYVKLSGLRNEKYSDYVEASENRLIEMVNFLGEQTVRIGESQTSAYTKRLYVQMADLILESRSRIRQAKANVIDTTFARMRQLLDVKDLRPTYHLIPEASEFAELSPRELAPTKLPKKLKKLTDTNVFLNAIQTKDFAKLTDEDIAEIFWRSQYSNNLQDLGFLIDRLRLKRAVDKANAPDKKTVYDVIIPKLEYLSKRLHEFGKRELLKTADKNFDTMSLEHKKVNLWYVARIARRLGYIGIQEMDEALLKESSAYADYNIRKYMSIFKNNPNLYFN